MQLLNNTSNFSFYTDPKTKKNTVILPYSQQALSEHEINKKIEKTENHINCLTNAQSSKKTHGGKRFRDRQISLQDQIQLHSERLASLKSAKEELGKQPLSKKKRSIMKRTLKAASRILKFWK